MSSKIEIESLACGAGDIKLSFNANDPMEVERAKRIVKDMLRRGYALFVQGPDGTMQKVLDFNERHGAYVIAAGAETYETPAVDLEVERNDPAPPDPNYQRAASEQMVEKRRRGRPRKEIKMSQAKVVAVGRSAGG